MTLEIAADRVSCVRTRWESTATVRVRRAEVDLGYAVWTAPVALTAHPVPFTDRGGVPVDESLLTGPDRVRVTSVQGVDAAHLVLTDTDLSDCLFSGAFHLDSSVWRAVPPSPHPHRLPPPRHSPDPLDPPADPGRGTPLARPESRTAPRTRGRRARAPPMAYGPAPPRPRPHPRP
ncbi:hypothetical protein Shyd_83150 [Streptomyces hydrogenans]|uniref:Uncharacterized protein n=1 Tax=Streptomyces hydrogenans TaxID=1873719 RepID=A0ABQ3PPK1_9ACTN|nr:hypothetical protein Shyd_83150 [Streptomyces hydrogenans]